MKAIMVMFDSLNRHMLPPYGGDWVKAPNFARLAKQSVTFDNSYVGSMPCMPARRELHTGRYNFLHRSWGPLEPFDVSMPELLKQQGIYSHLVTDHQHYFEDGGGTYHTRYSSWEFMRGQEGDTWKGQVAKPEMPDSPKRQRGHMWRQDWINRQHLREEAAMPQAKTFAAGLEFIDTNRQSDNWFLQIETFDPHEPFFTQQHYKDLYPHDYDGPHFDWPDYGLVSQSDAEVQHCRYEYAALVSMCDAYLGKVLDKFDDYGLWDDTLLIVNTDHGFLLGEKDWWAKMVQPMYNEVAHTPLFIWDPRCQVRNERRKALVQTIDLAPTLLDFFGLPVPDTMEGVSLASVIAEDKQHREAGMFGLHGGHVNVTDGRYVYMRAPNPYNAPLFDYTLMPTRMRQRFSPAELQGISLAEPFDFSQNCATIKAQGQALLNAYIYGTLLFDLEADPQQEQALQDEAIERMMITHLLRLMRDNDAPAEQYERLDLPLDGNVHEEHLRCQEKRDQTQDQIGQTPITWLAQAKSLYYGLLAAMPRDLQRQFELAFEQAIHSHQQQQLDHDDVLRMFTTIVPEENHGMMHFTAQFAISKGR